MMDFEKQLTQALFRRLMRSEPLQLCLVGPPHSGKTQLASALGEALHARNFLAEPPIYLNGPELDTGQLPGTLFEKKNALFVLDEPNVSDPAFGGSDKHRFNFIKALESIKAAKSDIIMTAYKDPMRIFVEDNGPLSARMDTRTWLEMPATPVDITAILNGVLTMQSATLQRTTHYKAPTIRR